MGSEWRRVRKVQATLGLAWASRPTPMPAWGDLEIRREPFRWGRIEGELGLISIETIAPAHPGTILGSLPAGEHVFEVWVGKVKHPKARVQLRAGRIAVLWIFE